MTFHLEEEKPIIYNPSDIITTKNSRRKSMLLGWYDLNIRCPEANKYLFIEIPIYFVYNQDSGEWTPRQRGKVIVRLHTVPPHNRELFHFRMLLLHIRGAK